MHSKGYIYPYSLYYTEITIISFFSYFSSHWLIFIQIIGTTVCNDHAQKDKVTITEYCKRITNR